MRLKTVCAWLFHEDFLKSFETKGVGTEVKDGDAKTLELKLIQVNDSSGN